MDGGKCPLGWLQRQKQNNWQHRVEPIWAAALWKDTAAWVENMVVKVSYVNTHLSRIYATEEHQNKQHVDQATRIEVSQVALDWQHNSELLLAQWTQDTSGHQERDATHRWAQDQGME